MSLMLAAVTLAGQTTPDPRQLPRVQAGDVKYLGSFALPTTDGTGRERAQGALTWGGYGLGLGPDGKSLYFGCHDWGQHLARVTIPDLGAEAAIVEPCRAVKGLEGINPGDENGIKLGGSLSWNDRLIVSAHAFYDAGHSAVATHFAGANLTSLAGPVRVGKDRPGMVGGFMGVVPPEWRQLLGGPALTGLCCVSIISRSSYGPSISVFDPDHVGTRSSVPSTMLLGYPDEHQALGKWDGTGPYYNGTTKVGGVAFPAGTRSVLFVQRHGSAFCYGPATSDKALAGKPDGQGNTWCFDPSETDKGVYGFPYQHMVLAYDAVDLLAVKNGRKAPWDVKPYASWPLTEMSSGGVATMRAAAFDPATRRWYVVEKGSDDAPRVHVYEIGQPAPSTRPPDDAECDDDSSDSTAHCNPETSSVADFRSGWEPDLSLDGGLAGPASVAACDEFVHLARGNAAVHYRRSSSEGSGWNEWRSLGDGWLTAGTPLACDGQSVVLAVQRGGPSASGAPHAGGSGDLWVWMSRDGGVSWQAPVKVSSGAGPIMGSSATVRGMRVSVLWAEREPLKDEWDIRFRQSSDGGLHWDEVLQLKRGLTHLHAAPALGDIDGNLVAVWTASPTASVGCTGFAGTARLLHCADLTVMRRVAGTWQPSTRIDSTAAVGPGPALAVAGASLVLCYGRTNPDRTRTLDATRSLDHGFTWNAPTPIGTITDSEGSLSAAARSTQVICAWSTSRTSEPHTVIAESADGGSTWGALEWPAGADADATHVAQSRNFVHVVTLQSQPGTLVYHSRRRTEQAPPRP